MSKKKKEQPSEHCTLWPDKLGSMDYSQCCKRHDRRYENKRLSKYQADKLLYRCVRRKSNKLNAAVMFIGVTLFGHFSYYRAQFKTGVKP